MRTLNRAVLLVAVTMLLAMSQMAPMAAQQTTPGASAQLQAAINKEVVAGDVKAAIEMYRKLADGPDHAVAARALVRLGQCYEKLGAAQSAQARKAYERVVTQFPDQAEAVAQAKPRLAALTRGTAAGRTFASPLRLVYQGTERRFPKVTGDGRYASFWTSSVELRTVRDLATGSERELPQFDRVGRDGELYAEISPDGQQVVYVVGNKKGSSFESTVKVTRLDGTNPRVFGTLDNFEALSATWSEDGKRIVVWGEPLDGSLDKTVAYSVVDGTVVWTLDEPLEASQVSPDGRYAAAEGSREAKGSSVRLIDTRSGKKVPLTEKGLGSRNPIWTADGSAVLFLRDTSTSTSLWMARIADGAPVGTPVLLKDGIGTVKLLGMSRDGTLFYWRETGTSEWQLVTLDRATGQVLQPLKPVTGLQFACGGVDWSPDGTSIVYGASLKSSRGEDWSPCTLVVVRSLESGRERVVATSLTSLRRLKWSPDGRMILVNSTRDGVAGIYGVDATTGESTLLVRDTKNSQPGEAALYGTWVPGGKGFYYGVLDNGQYTFVYRDMETGRDTERFTLNDGGWYFLTQTSVSQDGKVALLGFADLSSVVVVADGQGTRRIFQADVGSPLAGIDWTADGKAVWASRHARAGAPGQRELIRIPLDGGPPESAGFIPPIHRWLDIRRSPDGTRLILGTYPVSGELWAVDNVLSGAARQPAKK